MDKPEVELRYEYNEEQKCFALSPKLPVWPNDVPCQWDVGAHGDVRLSKRYIPLPVAIELHNLDEKATLKVSISGDPINPFEGEPSEVEVSPRQIYPLFIKMDWGMGYGAAVAVDIEPEGCEGMSLKYHTSIHVEC